MSQIGRGRRFPGMALAITLAALSTILVCWGARAGTITPKIQIGREAVPAGGAGCRERAWIRNESDRDAVRVRLMKIQHLFSGEHSGELVIDLIPGQRFSLGCTSWPGAMAKTEFRVLAVAYIPPAGGMGPGEECIEEGGVFPVTATSPGCCSGLVAVGCAAPDSWGECLPCVGASYCVRCGDGFCGPGENLCRCPEDCGEGACKAPTGYRVLTVDQLEGGVAEGRVALIAVIEAASPRCSERDCPDAKPCCSPCEGGYRLASTSSNLAVIGGEIKRIGCSGDDCHYPSECTPLDPGIRYLLWGRWRPEGEGGHLELDGFCTPIERRARPRG